MPSADSPIYANLLDYRGFGIYQRGLEDILGLSYEKLRFSQLLSKGKNKAQLNQMIKYAVLAFASKTTANLEKEDWADKIFYTSISPEQTLSMLNEITTHEESLQTKLFTLLMNDLPRSTPLFYKHTNVHYGRVMTHDTHNHNTFDDYYDSDLVMLAVLSDHQGMPFAYEMDPDGDSDVITLISVITEIVEKHPVKNLRIVMDHGILSGFSEEDHQLLQRCAGKLGIKAKCVMRRPDSLWLLEEFFNIHGHLSKVSAQVFLYFLAHCALKYTELTLKQAGFRLKPQNLRYALSEVAVMVFEPIGYGLAKAMCAPQKLSPEAKKIYSIFGLEFPMTPYKANMQSSVIT